MKFEDKYTVAILGNGFVGSALGYALSTANINSQFDIRIYDVDPKRRTHNFEESVEMSEFIFLCLPTPPKKDYSIDTSIIESVLKRLSKFDRMDEKIVIVKSTVLPGFCKKMSKKHGLRIVDNPEYLTARNAKMDMIYAPQITIGSDDKKTGERVKELYMARFGKMKYTMTDSITSEMTKYVLNCFFATKLSFLNEMKQLADKIGVNWEKLIEGFVCDLRTGKSHTIVGENSPDGKLGWGNLCFIKDVSAITKFAEDNDVDLKTLKGAWQKNVEVRKGVIEELEEQVVNK